MFITNHHYICRGPVLSNPAVNRNDVVTHSTVPPLALYNQPHPPRHPPTQPPHHPPSIPKSAWNGGDTLVMYPHPPTQPTINPTPLPGSQMSDVSSQAHTIQTHRSQRARKEEKINEEWYISKYRIMYNAYLYCLLSVIEE